MVDLVPLPALLLDLSFERSRVLLLLTPPRFRDCLRFHRRPRMAYR